MGLKTGACRIGEELDALQSEVDALKRLEGESATKLDALIPAILDKAFKGDYEHKGSPTANER
jgi:hypothetical protein